jgi:subtilisin family serine protease
MATDNPFLQGITQDLTSNCPQVNIHPTIIAGIIHSSSSTVRGIAPSSDLWVGGSCSGTDASVQERATAAVSWGARILSLSWGDQVNSMRILSANDRFFDDMVFNRLRTVVKSAGNHGETDSEDIGRVTSPGLAYNVLTVGGFDDQNTTGWPDDQMAPFSSWGDPLSSSGDREKPEVVAPSDEIRSTTDGSPWLGEGGGNGTSWAAPVVAGLAALIIDANAALELWPEAIKAIVMASAIHNIEDDSRLSEKDGAGGVDAQTAVNLARELNNNGWEAFNYSCVAPTNTNVPISLSANKRTRVVIAWSTNPDYFDYEDRPSADLDLQVLAPSGAIVATSTSFDNTYEIVDFQPTVSGVHTVRIVRSRCQLSPRRLGVAWYKQ